MLSPTSDPWVLPSQAFSNITWACARVGHYNEELFDTVAARVAGRWDDICSFDLGSLAWGLGKAYGELGVKGPSLEHEEREAAIMHYLSEKPVREQVSLLLLLPCIPPHLHSVYHMSPHLVTHLAEPPTVLSYASILTVSKGKLTCPGCLCQALRAIKQAALHDLGSLNLRTVCNIAYGCASATFWDEQLMDALAQSAVDLAEQGNMQVGL